MWTPVHDQWILNDNSCRSRCIHVVLPVLNSAPSHEDKGTSGSTVPLIFKHSTRWRWIVILVLQPLYSQDKKPMYPVDRKLGEPQRQAVVQSIYFSAPPCNKSCSLTSLLDELLQFFRNPCSCTQYSYKIPWIIEAHCNMHSEASNEQ
jgi:hypothetical protein